LFVLNVIYLRMEVVLSFVSSLLIDQSNRKWAFYELVKKMSWNWDLTQFNQSSSRANQTKLINELSPLTNLKLYFWTTLIISYYTPTSSLNCARKVPARILTVVELALIYRLAPTGSHIPCVAARRTTSDEGMNEPLCITAVCEYEIPRRMFAMLSILNSVLSSCYSTCGVVLW
jgi:hypothetical protein